MDFSGKFTFFFGKKKDPKLPSQGFQIIPAPTFRQSEMRRCICCTPAQRTLISLDHRGYEQYTCPKTKATMRYIEAGQTKKFAPEFEGMYIQGGLIL